MLDTPVPRRASFRLETRGAPGVKSERTGMPARTRRANRATLVALATVLCVTAGLSLAAANAPFARGPFFERVTHPSIVATSLEEIDHVLGGETHRFGRMLFSTGQADNGVPVYVARERDPHYRIHCIRFTNCPLEGALVAIPRGAKAEGNLGNRDFEDDGHDDRHLAVRNIDTGIESDLWLSPEPSGNGGTLNIGYGGSFPANSRGVGHGGATASGFALSIGRIGADELLAGHMRHALFLITPCENGHVAPAIGDDNGRDAGCPPIGARLWLDTPPSIIARSGASRDTQTILRAMYEYGGFIGDRCTSCTLGLAFAGGLSDTAMGRRNPWRRIAARYPDEHPAGPRGEYHINVGTGSIDLREHLHVIAWP